MSGCWKEGKKYGMRSDANYPYTGSYSRCKRDESGPKISTVKDYGMVDISDAAT